MTTTGVVATGVTVTEVTAVGVLGLQGDFREHIEMLNGLGVDALDVRTPEDLQRVKALILPGGESTAISKLLATSGLFEAVNERLDQGDLAIFGTCAGMILSASNIVDGIVGQRSFGQFEATVRRNGIGRQVASFETQVDIKGMDQPFTAVFIRPPVVEQVAEGVEVLAEYGGLPILCRQGRHLFATFHPELTNDSRIHELFLQGIARSKREK